MRWWPSFNVSDVQEIKAILRDIKQHGRVILAQIDDLKAKMDAEDAKIMLIVAGVTAVAQEVLVLIDALKNHPAAPDLTPQIAQAQAAGDKLQAVVDALGAIPPAPAS